MKRTWRLLGITFVALVIVCEIPLVFGLSYLVQEKITDRLYLKKPSTDSIVIVAIDDESLATLGQWPWPRNLFAKALPHFNNAKAVGIDIDFSENSRLGNADDESLAAAFKNSSSSIVLPIELNAKNAVTTKPLALFLDKAKLGFVNVPLDGDSVARQSETSRGEYLSFARQISNSPAAPAAFRIDYLGGEDRFLTFSFSDVVAGNIPDRVFENKIVLIGVTAQSLHDTVDTPYGTISGVIVHANEISTLEYGIYFKNLSFGLSALCIFLITLVVFAAIHWIKKLQYLVPTIVAILVVIIAAASISFSKHLVIPILYFLLAYVISIIASITVQYIVEASEKRFIRKTFQYYLMPEVVRELMDNPHKLKLGGEKRTITIFFSDIRGFTTISEKLSPDALTQLINEYLTAMTDIIMEKRGLVDKYIGDAIMAFWGAPLENATQAKDACSAVLLMSSTLRTLNTGWEKRGIPHLGIGIGLNRGEVIVGNMGSEKRFNYTVMGDEVNFASRLEGLNKPYGTECIVSESVFLELKNEPEFLFRELDTVKVKGKKEPKKIFELVTAEKTQKLTEALEYFKKGKISYEAGNWLQAITEFKKAIEINNDAPSKTFIERCEYLMAHPPVQWDGVYEFTTK